MNLMPMTGKSVGRYRITEKLGEGGMGVVYRGEDTALGRNVAIKMLRAESSRDPERLRRFSQEARAASALNHPNIVTVHDIGEFEGQPFLVMEWVEGESLRLLADRGSFPLPKLLDIGVQTATALARAHESGITHRDLKPENLMLRPDGYVKVLDFGLAKLKEREQQPDASAAATAAATRTTLGAVVGTAAYMSPEQAQGREADARSDIFSLALVLLECWQGRNPFLRATALDTLHAIVHDRTPALSFPPAGVEWGLARILEKALEKDADERYQTMKDLAIDLRRLKQESDSGKMAPLAAPSAPVKTRPRLWPYAGAGLAVLLVAGLLLLFSRQKKPAAPAPAPYVQLTNFTDAVGQPALSPDGRMLAFLRAGQPVATLSSLGGPGQIYVKLLPNGEPVQLTHDNFGRLGPAFSPDGSRVAYTVTRPNWQWDTWVVPVLGGEPHLLLPNASGLTWADEKHVLFSEIKKGIHMAIVTATESRNEFRDVYVPPSEFGMAHFSYLSPDRRWVLLAEMDITGWLPCRVVPFDGSSTGRRVGPAGPCTSAAWAPDGKWMYFSANAGSGSHIWRQRFPDGAAEQVSFGATEEEGIAMAPDGRSFVTSIGTTQSAVWLHDSNGERQISSQGYAYRPSFSRDGSKLYYLVRSGSVRAFWNGELWAVDLKSGQQERLLPDLLMTHFDLSPDGKRLIFSALDANGKSRLWLASLEGRFPPRQLAPAGGPEEHRAFFGASGDLFFLADEGNQKFIYRMKEDGTERKKVVPDPVIFLLTISPDGQWAAAWVPTAGDEPSAVVAYPIAGGRAVLIRKGGTGPAREGAPLVNWAPDGKFFYLEVPGMGGPKTFAFPLKPGAALPPMPAAGVQSQADLARLPGVQAIPQVSVSPGPNPSVYAFSRSTTQRNLYRIEVQ